MDPAFAGKYHFARSTLFVHKFLSLFRRDRCAGADGRADVRLCPSRAVFCARVPTVPSALVPLDRSLRR